MKSKEKLRNYCISKVLLKSDLPRLYFGVSPSLKNVEINFDGIFHRYGEPPAIITANFTNKSSVTVYLSEEEKIHAVIRDPQNNIIRSRHQANKLDLPSVRIMPQVTPVQRDEVILSEDYVKSAESSYLSPLHFRNQLNVWKELFPQFQRIVENSWPGVRVLELITHKPLPHEPIFLEIRNEDFVAEVGSMGHGLQMWLQIMWFLTLSRKATTVILDEPDVYMHADLQRRLIRFLKNRHPQIILTTHSIEIMSEVQPDEILVVDKKRSKSTFAVTLPAVQKLIENVGSVHNIHLTKFFHAKKFIIVEGKDIKIIKQFQNILFPNSKEPFDIIPNMSIGGWGGWNYAIGSSMVLKNAVGETIKTYCIFDSDYHTKEEIEKRYIDAEVRGVELHIWSQKEIENYVIVPTIIHRLICKRLPKRMAKPTIEEIEFQLNDTISKMHDDVFDAISTEVLSRDRKLSQGSANQKARKIIKQEIEKNGSILQLVSGKILISHLSKWSQEKFFVPFNAYTLAREFMSHEVPEEMVKLVEAIELGESIKELKII